MEQKHCTGKEIWVTCFSQDELLKTRGVFLRATLWEAFCWSVHILSFCFFQFNSLQMLPLANVPLCYCYSEKGLEDRQTSMLRCCSGSYVARQLDLAFSLLGTFCIVNSARGHL